MGISKLFSFKSNWGIVIYRISIMMLFYTVCRILFYLFNNHLFPDIRIGQFFIMMAGGLRFDLSAILYLNLLYIVIQLIPFRFRQSKSYQRRADYIFIFTNAIGLALNCIDFIYYRFTQRRTTLMIFGEFKNEKNFLPLFKNFFVEYFYVILIWVLLILFLIWLSKRVRTINYNLNGIQYYVVHSLIVAITMGFVVIGIRSGLPPAQLFPLVPSDAGRYSAHPADAAIVQNTPFCMIRTSRKPVYKKQNYFTEQELKNIYNPVHIPDTALIPKKMNVIVLIVESLCKESIGFYNTHLENGNYKGYTPFIDSLATKSLVYLNSFANGKISIDASFSILASIPSLQECFSESFYANNKYIGIASHLSTFGYHSVYAHGGANGSISLDVFAAMAGFEKYLGKDQYGNDRDYDGVWGIWDHQFLPYFARECSKLETPFIGSVFTLSSHDPCKVPDELADMFDEAPMKIFRSLRYADYSLRAFFTEASKQPWFRNTIFVITGDHTSGLYHAEYQNSLGAVGVPLIFYTPGGQLPVRTDERVAQQIDVMPTLLNYLGYHNTYFAFGKDLFDNNQDKEAISYIGNAFQLIWNDWVILFDMTKTVGLYYRKEDPLLKTNLTGKNDTIQLVMERKVKAYIQQYNNRMVENRLIPSSFSDHK